MGGPIDIRMCLREVHMSIGDAYGIARALNRVVIIREVAVMNITKVFVSRAFCVGPARRD